MKKRIKYKLVKRSKVMKIKGLTLDQTIQLTSTKAKDCPIKLRCVGHLGLETGQHYVF